MKIISHQTYKIYKEQSEHIARLKKELEEAKSLKTILEKFSSLTINGQDWCITGGSWSTSVNLPDDVLRYVDDILGGKVIKQEGVKCLVIDKNGNVKTGLTKQAADTKYSYKLVRN